MLHDRGACMKPKQGGWDALMIAADSGHHELVEWLLARGSSYALRNHADKVL